MSDVHPDARYTPFYVGTRVAELRANAPAVAIEAEADPRVTHGGCCKCGHEILVNRAAVADLIDQGVSGQIDFYCSICAEKIQGWKRRQMPRWMRRAKARSN